MANASKDNFLFRRIEWLDTLNMEQPDIDADHHKLIDDTNIILAVLGAERPWAELAGLVRRMRENCIAHFRREEEILVRQGFAGAEAHAAEHYRIEQELADVVRDIESAMVPSAPARELADYFRSLLLNHFLRYDLKYKSHLLYKSGR
jgi:hemerythrin